MQRKFILGGYFIVLPGKRPDHMDANLVPDKILSLSSCICPIVPGIWGLEGVKSKKEEAQKAKNNCISMTINFMR